MCRGPAEACTGHCLALQPTPRPASVLVQRPLLSSRGPAERASLAYSHSHDVQEASGPVPTLPQLKPSFWILFPHLSREGLSHIMIHELEPEEESLLSIDAQGLACLLCPRPASSFELLGSFWVSDLCPCTNLHFESGGRMAVELQGALAFLDASSCPARKPQQLYLGLASTE